MTGRHMLEYQAPERDIEFLLFELFDMPEQWAGIPAFAEVSEDLVRAIVSEGGRLASEVMAPINQAISRSVAPSRRPSTPTCG